MALQMLGLRALQTAFMVAAKAGRNPGEAWVGSAVHYGPYQEFGTQYMMERPHWRVAIPQVIAEVGGNQKLQNQVIDALMAREASGETFKEMEVDAGDNAPLAIALMIERKVKKIITSKKIIDTGNYRASIASGTGEYDAYSKSSTQAFNGVG